MVTLLLLTLSAGVSALAAVSAHEFSEQFADWNRWFLIGIAVFLILQFLIITPCRMWRNAVWVRNIEEILDQLWNASKANAKQPAVTYSFVILSS